MTKKFLLFCLVSGLLITFAQPAVCGLEYETTHAFLMAQKTEVNLIFVDTSSSTDELVHALHHSVHRYQRRYAAQILGERKDASATPHLIKALEDAEDVVQRAAAEALVKIGEKSIFPSLMANLAVQNPSVRQYSAYVLGQMASKEDSGVVEALEYAAKDENNSVRLEVIYALYEVGSPSSVPIFVDGLQDHEARIRSYCANALGNLKVPDVGPALAAALDAETDEGVLRSIVSAMGKIGGSSSARTLAEAVTNETPSLRADIADALGDMKTPEATLALIDLLSDNNVKVRAQAAAALGKTRDRSSAGPLARALKDHSVQVRRPASEALIYVADSSVIKELVEALGDADAEVANNVVRALIQVNDLTAVHALIDVLDEDNKKPRAVAVLSELTHRPYGSDIAKWVRWYEENFKTGTQTEPAELAEEERQIEQEPN